MELIGTIVVYIIMACALAGAIASAIKPESELGQQFVAGIDSIGPIFLPVAGIMASAPFLEAFVSSVFGPVYSAVGADPAMAATTFIAVDMGGYPLAEALAQTKESWIMAMMTGYMAGATIVFTIPVALKMLEKRDRKYLALGVMSGLLAIPIGVLVASVIIAVSHPMIREVVSTNAEATYQLALSFAQIGLNLIPLVVICVALALGLKFKPDAMIKGFIVFGRVMEAALKIVFVLVVIEYFTGIFSTVFGGFGFDPIIASDGDPEVFRALETSGAIGMMLCGAFPMVYLIKRYLAKPLAKIGGVFGLSSDATAGLLAASANVLAALAMVKDLKARDKVLVMAFAVCCAFLFGDHLSFTANFQPTLIVPVLVGKFCAGVCAIIFANLLAVKKAQQLEAEDLAALPEDASGESAVLEGAADRPAQAAEAARVEAAGQTAAAAPAVTEPAKG